MREADNIAQLNVLEVDYMGLIFHDASPRNVLGPVGLSSGGIQRVGVFVDREFSKIRQTAEAYHLDLVQLHGRETPELCSKLLAEGITVIKAFSLLDQLPLGHIKAYEEVCKFFLFDTKGKLAGGNGKQFSWNILEDYTLDKPFFLSGGIGPEDAVQIRCIDHPQLYAVDINSGFESRPARKNIPEIEAFIKVLRA